MRGQGWKEVTPYKGRSSVLMRPNVILGARRPVNLDHLPPASSQVDRPMVRILTCRIQENAFGAGILRHACRVLATPLSQKWRTEREAISTAAG